MLNQRTSVRRAMGVAFSVFALALLAPSGALAQSETELYDDGTALLGQKKYAGAEAKFRKSVETDPRYKEAWESLAAALRAEGKTAQAAAVQKMADAATAPRAGAAPPLTAEQKLALAEVAGSAADPPASPVPNAAASAVVQPADAGPVEAQPKSSIPNLTLEKSGIVAKGPGGAWVVGQKNGKGVDGVQLSQHDLEIGSPSVAVAPDGTIHVAFVEKHRTTFAYAIYHRASTNGGKTWTEAKNLTEDLVGIGVGRCQIVADSAGRVYVVWRAGLGPNFGAEINPHSGGRHCNLWFRLFAGGKWSKAKLVAPAGTTEAQNDGTLSYFVTVDAAGRAQVVWNSRPDKWHDELVNIVKTTSGTWRQGLNGIGNGLVFQATLDGATAPTAREIFLPPITGEKNAGYGLSCDGLDSVNGYVDSAGVAHFVASVTSTANPIRGKSRYELIENGKAGEIIDLPELSFHEWMDLPTLLVDAKGQRHVIALYRAGERPHIRDYLLGSEDEPTVIRAAAPVKGTIDGFQAYQGPGGRMVAIIQSNDTGELGDADSFVTISTGDGKWSAPVNVTNNSGRKSFASRQTSSQSNVAVEKNYVPGVAAAAFDREGHLLLVMVNSERSLVASTAFGVNIAGGSTSTPTLRFLKF